MRLICEVWLRYEVRCIGVGVTKIIYSDRVGLGENLVDLGIIWKE